MCVMADVLNAAVTNIGFGQGVVAETLELR
jgi:hypothetical protein